MEPQWSRRRVLELLPIVACAALARAGSTPAPSPVGSSAASPAASPIVSGRPASVAGEVTIELTDAGFRPDFVQATNGTDLHLTLRNTGTRDHAFQIERLDVDETVAPGEEKHVTIKTPPLGDFMFTSDAEGDENFKGTLVFYI